MSQNGTTEKTLEADVVIVGAGPAGTAMAAHLGQIGVANVTLLDKHDFPRDKTCGSGVSPKGIQVLRDLGLWEEVKKEAYAIQGLRLVTPQGVESYLSGGAKADAVVCQRRVLDHLILKKALAGGVRFEPNFNVDKLIEEQGRVVGVTGKDGRSVRAKYTIIAGGTHCSISHGPTGAPTRGKLVPERRPRKMIQAIMGWWDNVPFRENFLEMVYDPEVVPYYGWLFPESPTRVNIGITYEDPNGKRNARELFAGFLDRQYKDRLAGATQVGGWKGHPVAYSYDIEGLTSPGRFVIGESGLLTHPATAEGIYQGMKSGMLAAESVRDILVRGVPEVTAFAEYERHVKEVFRLSFIGGGIFRRLMKTPAPRLDHPRERAARGEAHDREDHGRDVEGAARRMERRSKRPLQRDSYDVAIVGAGPAGCVTALAFAKRGARVLLLEANPQASRRLAGEWIHPPAVEILRDLGIDLRPAAPFCSGRGFVAFPDDGTRPIVLPYEAGRFGYSFEHGVLVETLRAHADEHPLVDYVPYARATRLEDHRLTYQLESGGAHTVKSGLLVGASGRMSVAHNALGIRRAAGTYSRMAGLLLEDVEMPFEGYGHVCLGGLGPILAYRIDSRHVRLQMDVPLSLRLRRDRQAVLYEAYAPALPEQLRPAFRRALLRGGVMWATNQIRPRLEFGRDGLALVGDAVGYHHPLTAVGMTMGFQDAIALANAKSFRAYRRERILRSRVPEMLAVALYEVFADTSDEVVAIRRAIYELWRQSPAERFKTMRFLGCTNTDPAAFGSSFFKAMLVGSRAIVKRGLISGRWEYVRSISTDLAERSRWLIGGALHLSAPAPTLPPNDRGGDSGGGAMSAEERFGVALKASSVKADVVELPNPPSKPGEVTVVQALDRGVKAFLAMQAPDGAWEGEVVWCPLLAAQLIIASHLVGREIDPARRRRFLLHFERTRFPDGTWGLSESSHS